MKHTSIIVAVGLALTAALPSFPAIAMNGRTFVSPTGSDSNPCTLALPCRNLQAALNQTNPGGEISILGTAGYSGGATLTIDRAISIVNPGAFEAGISPPSGGTGITINAGPFDFVSLRGLTIEGGGVGQTGIQFNTGQYLTVENCVIRHLVGDGIDFSPNGNVTSLAVSNTVVSDNGNTGIAIFPSGPAIVYAVISHVQTNNNFQYGVFVWGDPSFGGIQASVSDSIAADNRQNGYYVLTHSGHAPATLVVVRSVVNHNYIGVYADGTATLRLASSSVTGNQTGWGGGVLSAGNNTIEENFNNDNVLPPTYALK